MTTQIANLSDTELETLRRQIRAEYDVFRARGLKLDMTRGKPAPEQLDLAEAMLALPGNRNHLTEVWGGRPQLRGSARPPRSPRPVRPAAGRTAGPDRRCRQFQPRGDARLHRLGAAEGRSRFGRTVVEPGLHLSCSRLRPPLRAVRGIRHPHAAGPDDRPRSGYGRGGSTRRRPLGQRHVVCAEILQS